MHSEHTEALTEVLMAEDVSGAFESSSLAGCPECRAAVEEHLYLVSDLEDLGRDEELSQTAAAALDVSPGRAEAAFREHVLAEIGSEAPDSPARRGLLVVLAIAAALLAAVGWRFLDPEDGRDSRVLGDGSILVHPRGTVESFTPFRWSVKLPQNGWFVVTVVGEDLELESPRLQDQEWTPETEPDWPAEIRWTLEVFRGTGVGDVAESYTEWAER